MAEDPTTERSGDRDIKLDVLIIGGGVLGLWLLNVLRQRNYRALLVERRELGGEQTCHSHVYVHQGHLYREMHGDLPRELREVHQLWQTWLSTHPVARGFEGSCFGFKGLPAADARLALWKKLNLPFSEVDRPHILHGGVVRRTFSTGECCLTGESLVDSLRAGLDDDIAKIDAVESIELVPDSETRAGRVSTVRVRAMNGSVVFRPRALVLAAGVRNQALLDLAAAGRRPLAGVVRNAHQLRLAHMLVIRGAASRLAPLTGIFPDVGGLFLVARVLDGEVVWLVSDDRSSSLSETEDWLEYDAREWLPRVVLGLRQIAPKQFCDDQLKQFQWGVYEAPKAERRITGALPNQEHVEQFHIANLWTVWPTKLTLAPKASQTVADQIDASIGPPRAESPPPHAWMQSRWRPNTAPERWRLTPLVSWDEFRRCHSLDLDSVTERVC